MAKIPLRAYIKDIDNQIERGEIDQAVAHAKNILKSYPKNIDTYRLLGKAFLESQRYSEAADILQRVLSVMPDDFVSQVGMSIIREDEGNLDASIWHMERAYEVQPFNPAVQEELRRLYGRRDGIEPPKIRLTRGALVRMYTRGELYPQAIAETRAALAEDPQRFDLLVLLARLYYLSDHKNDAAEVCSELLRKLPYCYEANRLLAEILPSTNRAEEAQKFLQRIYTLDPYAAFISPTAPTSDQVPDQAVMVEQFTWESAMEEARTPEWTRDVGVEWEETAPEEALPDWLSTLKPEESASSKAPESNIAPQEPAPSAEAESQEPPKDEVIPDWMKDAGWIKSDRKADEVMASQPEQESDEILPAEIPDWVQSIAPQGIDETPQDDERTNWLEDILTQPEGEDGKSTEIVPPPAPEKDESQEGLPDWVTGAGTGTQLPEETGLPVGDLPDWFSQIEEEKLPGEPAPAEESKPTDLEGLPDWSQLGEPSTTEPAQDIEKAPDWLQSFDMPASETQAPTEQTPDWLKSFEPEQPGQAETTGGVTDWLQSIQAETAEPAAGEEIPEWLQPIGKDDERTGLSEEARLPEAIEPPEALSASQETGLPESAGLPEAAQFPEESNVPVETEIPQVEVPGEIPAEALADATASGETAPTSAAAEGAAQGMPDFSDMDAAMAWLESLAAKQGADEATLVTKPEERLEQPPDWVAREMETQEAAPPLEEAGLPGAGEEMAAPAETPVEPAVTTEAPISAAESTGELPDWLQNVEAEPAPPSIEAEPPALEEPPVLQETPTLAETAIPPASELPDWLQAGKEETVEEPIETAPTTEASAQPAAGMPDFSDMDAAMAWLESLAAKQGADEATLVTKPEERLEQPPEWVTREVESAEPAPAEEEIETAAQAEQPVLPEASPEALPSWLDQSKTIVPEETAAPAAEGEPAVAEEPAFEQPASEQISQPEAAAPDFSDMDAAMAWLESLAAKQGADEATLVTSPDQRLEQPPEWVTKEMEAQEPSVAEPPALEPEAGAFPAMEGITGEIKAEEEQIPAEEAVLPDWLQDAIKEETSASEAPAEESTEPIAAADLQSAEAPEVVEPAGETPAAPAGEMDLDSAFAWLESLAQKQGAEEGTLITTPEERVETPPEWVQEEQASAGEPAAAEAAAADVTEIKAEAAAFEPPAAEAIQAEAQPTVDEPITMEEPLPREEPAEAPAEEAVEAPAPPAAEEFPDWLASIEHEEPALAEESTPWPAETQPAPEQPPATEPMPDWLQQPAETSAISEIPPTEPEAVPEWLMGLEAETETEPEAFPQEVEAPPAAGDFRSAWEPEEAVSQAPVKETHMEATAGGSLAEIQAALSHGDLEQALSGYNDFIQNGQHLDETIHDLRDALYRYPVDISIWQTLGDAYARNNQLQEALDAYTKAEELLR